MKELGEQYGVVVGKIDDRRSQRFYQCVIERINQLLELPEDLCFVFVQHAFSPCLNYFNSVEPRLAAVIPKGSSARCNPAVVAAMKEKFPDRILDKVSRKRLSDPVFALQLLEDVTRGRPFAILEYGGYFAPVARHIDTCPKLGPKLAGFVEGTENGVRGSDDGTLVGYAKVAAQLRCPVISKSRSALKCIMDMEIGPAIVQATDKILSESLGCRLSHWRNSIGVIGLGPIGRGVLSALKLSNCDPMLFDSNQLVTAEMVCQQNNVVSQHTILANSDILFLNTGSCFLASFPEMLNHIKDHALLVLCTSGDVEAGIPQLLAGGYITLLRSQSTREIAVYTSYCGKTIRVLLGMDGVGQAPNMTMEDGCASASKLMSDMEFYALGCYLGSRRCYSASKMPVVSPAVLQNVIVEEWLSEFHPSSSVPQTAVGEQLSKVTESHQSVESVSNVAEEKIVEMV